MIIKIEKSKEFVMFRYIEISLSSLIFSTTLNKKNGIKITLIRKFKKAEI
jgi:hypothetical protein